MCIYLEEKGHRNISSFSNLPVLHPPSKSIAQSSNPIHCGSKISPTVYHRCALDLPPCRSLASPPTPQPPNPSAAHARRRERRSRSISLTSTNFGCAGAHAAHHLDPPVPAQRRLRELVVHGGMDKLVQFGRKAWFVVRVLSGYEERRIRSYRLQLQKRLEQAQARKEEVRKQPEQVILSEVRQVVQQMQALNQHLDEAETAIDEYFKPIDKNAQIITDMQMEKEEKQMKEMAKVMQEQIKMQREIAMRRAEATAVEPNDTQASETMAESPPKQETIK